MQSFNRIRLACVIAFVVHLQTIMLLRRFDRVINPLLRGNTGNSNWRAFSKLTQDTGENLVEAVQKGKESIVTRILKGGIDPNFRWKENVTPVMIAAENNKMSIMLQLVKHGANINLQDDLGETALMKASRESHKDIVLELVKHGAQKDILNYENMTARDETRDVRVDAVLAGEPSTEGTIKATKASGSGKKK